MKKYIIVFIFCILGNLTDTVKLDKFQSVLTSGFKWIVGIVFTVFAGFLSIQGITAGRFDSVSIKATKFAIKSYIPIVGSYIADGMDFLVLGSVLVKNTVGLVGVLIVFVTIISPVLSILIIKLGLQFSGAILEMCTIPSLPGAYSTKQPMSSLGLSLLARILTTVPE